MTARMPPITHQRKCLRLAALLFGLAALAMPAGAALPDAGPNVGPNIEAELVHTLPPAAGLSPLGLRAPADVWCDMVDAAQTRIDIEQFYATSRAQTALDQVIRHLEQAATRGVRIRFLMEKKGIGMSDPDTLARIQRIPNIDFRLLAYADISGSGIIHAKFFIVDGRSAYVGSQNFDWRALEQIDETGLKIDEAKAAAQIQAIFDTDWAAAGMLAAGKPVPTPRPTPAGTAPETSGAITVLASPARFNPPGVADSEQGLVDILAHARQRVRVAVMEYAPLGQNKSYYGILDQALRAAASRGVQIELLVADWNLTPLKQPYLKSLALLPNIAVRVLSLPPDPAGFIPFARVLHSKIMTVDDTLAWVGTSNWEGGYFDTSRNIEIVVRDRTMTDRLNALHQQLWLSRYAAPLDPTRTYPAPHPGTP